MEKTTDTKARILESAVEILEKDGLKGITIEKLIKKCGIGKTTFYRFFPTKKDLLLQLKYYSKNDIKISSVKDRIAEIAKEGFSKYGFTSLDMDSIARAANLNRVTLYRYFSNKDELLEYCIQGEFDRIKSMLAANVGNVPDPEKALKEHFNFLNFFFKISSQNSLISETWNQTLRNPRIKALARDLYSSFANMFARILEAGKEQGIFRKDVDSAVFTSIIIMLQNGIMFTLTFEPEVESFETVKDYILDMILRELKP